MSICMPQSLKLSQTWCICFVMHCTASRNMRPALKLMPPATPLRPSLTSATFADVHQQALPCAHHAGEAKVRAVHHAHAPRGHIIAGYGVHGRRIAEGIRAP